MDPIDRLVIENTWRGGRDSLLGLLGRLERLGYLGHLGHRHLGLLAVVVEEELQLLVDALRRER
jgi:hypothetical protein